MADTIIFPAILIPYNGSTPTGRPSGERGRGHACNVPNDGADEPPRRMPYPARRGAFLENAAMRREMFKL
jgi:hypothetical protein